MFSTPSTVHATGDPGDETARRYRFQSTFAATLCCMLLDETQDVAEVFCEHHEDVLIKYADGTYSGLQIKTRASDQNVWKTDAEAVRSACARFSKLEADFPGQFRAFRFLTNHPLFAGKSSKDLRYVLQKIREAISPAELSSPITNFLTRAANDAGCPLDVAFTALSKADASDELPKLADIEVRLVTTLASVWAHAVDCSYASVQQVARNLASECWQASSLAHQDVLPAYVPATINAIENELAARLEGKRMDRSRVLGVLDRGLHVTAPLDGNPDTCVTPGTGTKDLLLKKLDAGGFSIVSRNSAVDLRDKADYLGIAWTKKHGHDRGLQRYGHVRSLVLNDAGRAFEATRSEEHKFGPQMLSELRIRFRERRTEGSQLYDCSNEHLEGFAYSLTSQCQVQWSIDRPWEDE